MSNEATDLARLIRLTRAGDVDAARALLRTLERRGDLSTLRDIGQQIADLELTLARRV